MNYDCELPEFYTEERVKARKEHRCCETGRTITKGEYYWRCTGKWDGEVRTHAQCESAYHFARYINLEIIGECEIAFGEVGSYVGEYFCTDDPADLRVTELWRGICAGEVEFTKESRIEGVEKGMFST